MFRMTRMLCAVMAAGVAVAAPVRAENFNMTVVSGHGTQLPWIRMLQEFYLPEVNKRLAGKHAIKFQEAYSGTVVKLGGELNAVRQGVAEMAHVYTIFEPANLPLLQVTHVTPFSVASVPVLSRVIVEMNHEMKELQAQWQKQNQMFLGAVVNDSVQLFTKKPVNSLDDLKGVKVGASGTLSLWASGIGMVPVQGDFSTHYNNLKTGIYDALIAFITGSYPIKVHEVAPHMNRVDFGATSIGAITINLDTWKRLPPDVQKVMREVGDEYSRRLAETLTKLTSTFEANWTKEGGTIAAMPQAERIKWASTMPNIAQDWVKRNEERGLPAGTVLKTYTAKLRAAGEKGLRDWEKR